MSLWACRGCNKIYGPNIYVCPTCKRELAYVAGFSRADAELWADDKAKEAARQVRDALEGFSAPMQMSIIKEALTQLEVEEGAQTAPHTDAISRT